MTHSWPLILFLLLSPVTSQAESVCYGTTGNGRLESGVKLPPKGQNYESYGTIPSTLGRTYVHSKVSEIVLTAFENLATNRPNTRFIYGETGKQEGGEFEPHKTHQNGLSVDFMVPILNAEGASVPLPTSPLNKWGYDITFDSTGSWGEFQIDFEAVGAHLVELHKSALSHGVDLWRVIFAPDLQEALYATSSGSYIQQHITIPTKRSWVRHDEHYHVDFAIPCQENS